MVLILDIFSCDPPSPPSKGYIDSYDHTAGLSVSFVCQNSSNYLGEMESAHDVVLHTALCTVDGNWEPNLDDICSHQGMYSLKY